MKKVKAMTEQTEREAFEKWAKNTDGNAWYIGNYSNLHGYIDGPTNVAFVGFKAGRQALVEDAVKKFEALRRQKSSSGVFPLWNMVTLDKAIAILKEAFNG